MCVSKFDGLSFVCPIVCQNITNIFLKYMRDIWGELVRHANSNNSIFFIQYTLCLRSIFHKFDFLSILMLIKKISLIEDSNDDNSVQHSRMDQSYTKFHFKFQLPKKGQFQNFDARLTLIPVPDRKIMSVLLSTPKISLRGTFLCATFLWKWRTEIDRTLRELPTSTTVIIWA